MPIETVAALLEALGRHQLLPPEYLAEATGPLQACCTDARALARELVCRGRLTPYQANQLLKGHGADLVLGPYQLLERLGEGGMGQVFKARHCKLGRVVALKVIHPECLADADSVRRFRREIQAAAQLDHPHVVRAYDAGEAGGRHFLVMECVAGIDLKRLVKERGPLPVAEACAYARQAALGLQHAHERGMVHRDVKPSNLLLVREPDGLGVVKLLDLGLVRLARTADGAEPTTFTEEGWAAGTPDYLAPEQASDPRKADARSDLYSLGCTLYFLLAGRPPFPDGSATDKLIKHAMLDPVPVEQLRADVPPGLAAMLRKLLAKRPEDRFQTAADLAEALAALPGLGDRPPPGARAGGHPASPPLPTQRDSAADSTSAGWSAILERKTPSTAPAARQRRLWPAAVGGVILVGLAALAVLFLRRPGPNGAPTVPEPSLTPEQLAFAELGTLGGRLRESRDDREQLRLDLLAFRSTHGTVPLACVEAAAMLHGLPSPPDRLDPEKIPPAERFAWQPRELVAVLGEHRRRHWGGPVNCVALSPDGKRLASGGREPVVRLWDADTGKELANLLGHTNAITTVAFSPDGGTLASGSGDGSVRLWDMSRVPSSPPAGRPARLDERTVLQGKQGTVYCVAFSPDGKTLATADQDGTLQLWNVRAGTRRAVLRGHTGKVRAVAFAPDGKTLASGGDDGTIRLWDMTEGEPPANERAVGRERSPVLSLAFAPDGKTLVSGGQGAVVRRWDVATAAELTHVEQGSPVQAVAFNHDGRRLLTGTLQGVIKLWDTATGKPDATLVDTHELAGVMAVAWEPRGGRLAVGTGDGIVRLWDAGSPAEREPLPLPSDQPACLAVTPDGRALLTGGSFDGKVRHWDLATGRQLEPWVAGPPHSALQVAVHPDGRTLATANGRGEVKLWEAATHQPLATLQRAGESSKGYVLALAFSPDGRLLAAADQGGLVRLWDVDARRARQPLGGHTSAAFCLAFAPDGTALASGGIDQKVQLWRNLEAEPVPTTWTANHQVHGVAISPDGKTLAAACYYEVTRWDVATGQKLTSLAIKNAFIYAVAFSPDGKTLAALGDNGLLLWWDAATGKPRGDWQAPGPVPPSGLAFTPDSRHLAVLNGNGTIYVLRLEPSPPSRS
jgi:WD40 repeat protein/serine/threonine protein kinase